MILMAVCYDDTFYTVDIPLYISKVRDYKVNAQHVLIRECQSAVHKEHILPIFKEGHVLSDLI